ncbi:ABC transporter permease [Lysobacter enzymogenes]|uniref:FtsX-like permease family protein n=1 Tax=Lysobacter enzymogenes TaxID=69 RepID=A0A3N2RAR0_LYSEN|nr:FtsX-like permease family protein [Lysobacter enzymogenes]ROU04497.1 FtsX-like permease family protein [Lysobacter enzymogenes]
MDIRPILTTLRRHKTAAALIVFEVALTCAIICNALFLIQTRIARLDRPSGMAEKELLALRISDISNGNETDALTRSDLAALRAIPGVRSATISNQVRYGDSAWNSGIGPKPSQQVETASVTTFFGDAQLLDTLGAKLVAGRNFSEDEIVDFNQRIKPDAPPIPVAIVTKALADKLFPGQDPLGRPFYNGDTDGIRIVGVVEHLLRPNELSGPAAADYSVIYPSRVDYNNGFYLIRVNDPAQRKQVLEAVGRTLSKNGAQRILAKDYGVLEEMADKFHRTDRSMVWLLGAVCVALLIVTALGIVGLASFWVQQRTKQIGVRRALGATRGQILRYFQTENFLLTGIGIVLGMVIAFAINLLLMKYYELPRLPVLYLPLGALSLWLLGQLAVYGPARRAAMVPPALATRAA